MAPTHLVRHGTPLRSRRRSARSLPVRSGEVTELAVPVPGQVASVELSRCDCGMCPIDGNSATCSSRSTRRTESPHTSRSTASTRHGAGLSRRSVGAATHSTVGETRSPPTRAGNRALEDPWRRRRRLEQPGGQRLGDGAGEAGSLRGVARLKLGATHPAGGVVRWSRRRLQPVVRTRLSENRIARRGRPRQKSRGAKRGRRRERDH